MAHPRKFNPDSETLAKLRELCLSFPNAYEQEAWGECTFRVEDGTMFAISDNDHHGSGHQAVWVKAPPLAQEQMVEKDPQRYFRPPYMGPKGWVGIRLDVGRVPWKKVREIVAAGYEMSAPKKKAGTRRKKATKKLTKRSAKKAPAVRKKKTGKR